MGKARILTTEEQENLFYQISKHRHPEKNRLIMLLSFRLGLRVQEIALLTIKEVVELEPPDCSGKPFVVNQILALPKGITKGSDAMKRSRSAYKPKKISFTTEEFDQLIEKLALKIKAGESFEAKEFYPNIRKNSGKSRNLPLVDRDLREAIYEYIILRLNEIAKHNENIKEASEKKALKKTDPLIISQKRGPYSPNTLQEHMALMIRKWAGVEKGSSHSGRRTVLNDIIHKQRKPLKLAQQIAGHVNGSTTLIYTEAPEEDVAESLENLSTKSPV